MTWEGFGWRGDVVCSTGEMTSSKGSKIIEAKTDPNVNSSDRDKKKLLNFIQSDVIGRDAVFRGPFGLRQLLYCDYVASGKSLDSIEQFLQSHVLPTYANTHTHSTVTASQTSAFRNEAKEIIRKAVGANDDDVVIFTGSGVTGAVHKLISVLNLSKPPVVFCGPFEHHSNLLPWRQMDGHVVNISETSDGRVNLRHLEIALRTWADSGRPLIGTFSAASNITGITTDTHEVSSLLHKYEAISLWDYATGAPYMDIEMHPEPLDGYDTSKDAIFISMHKFVGSPDAPGLLVASKHLFRNPVPTFVGGGTVLFVSENDHRYLKDIESREEGGTPAIIGSIRAGLAFKLKMAVGCNTIMSREDNLCRRAMEVWSDVAELEILGVLDGQQKRHGSGEQKLAVFSFLIRHFESGYYLHYNFVTALLNDLFGIQTRGGCACAGVYAQHLLGIDRVAERRFGAALVEDSRKAKTKTRHETERTKYEILRPGFTRLNFSYFMSDEDADFIISAVATIAKNGWALLPRYQFNAKDGSWTHRNFLKELEEKRLEDVTFQFDGMHFNANTSRTASREWPTSRIDCLNKAERILFNATKIAGKDVEDRRQHFSDSSVKNLRWFLLPYEAQCLLKGKTIAKKSKLIFETRREIRQLTNDEMKLAVCSSTNDTAQERSDEPAPNGGGCAKIGFRRNDDGSVLAKEKKKTVFKSLRQKIFCKTNVDVISKRS